MEKQENETGRDVLSVGAGIATGFCLGVALIYLCAMMLNSGEGVAAMLLFLSIGIFIPTFSAGLVCGYISNRKDNILTLITSFILIFILSLNNDFKFNLPAYRVLILFSLIIVFTYLGGIVGKKIKGKLST